MRGPLNIEIAEINLSVRYEDSITPPRANPNYTSFLKTEQNHTDIDITIRLDVNEMPDIDRLTSIFNSDISWSMLRDKDSYFVTLNPPALDKKPVWIAQLDPHVTKVHVFLNAMFLGNNNDMVTVPDPISYPLDQILMMYFLAQRKGAIVHAAGAVFNNRGYIFPGKSGAGKSTLTRQLACIDGFFLLSDDRMVVRKTKSTFKAFGTPWPGEAGVAVNRGVGLSGIFFISHAPANKIEAITPQEALGKLFPVVSIPWYDKEIMVQILDFCGELVSHIPAYEFYFKPDSEAIDVFKHFVTK